MDPRSSQSSGRQYTTYCVSDIKLPPHITCKPADKHNSITGGSKRASVITSANTTPTVISTFNRLRMSIITNFTHQPVLRLSTSPLLNRRRIQSLINILRFHQLSMTTSPLSSCTSRARILKRLSVILHETYAMYASSHDKYKRYVDPPVKHIPVFKRWTFTHSTTLGRSAALTKKKASQEKQEDIANSKHRYKLTSIYHIIASKLEIGTVDHNG